MGRYQVFLTDGATRTSVPAFLYDEIGIESLATWEATWQPMLNRLAQERGIPGQPLPDGLHDYHWPWRAIVQKSVLNMGTSRFCIHTEDNELQGMMTLGHCPCRLPENRGKDLIYVEWLATAPWNRPELQQPRKYGGVGSTLLSVAIQMSVNDGYKGRIGLDSTPQAHDFYAACGMNFLGPINKAGLDYFEFTENEAMKFLGNG